MNDGWILTLTRAVLRQLPQGYGWLCTEQDGEEALIVQTDFPEKAIWIARRLADGTVSRGLLFVRPTDSPEDLADRALAIIGAMEVCERRHKARWN